MSVRLVKNQEGITDVEISSSGGFSHEDFFDDIILVSLLEERRADESEIFSPEHRSGWKGNESLDFERGSKIWLYRQKRINRDTINGIESAASDALQRLVDNGYAKEINVSVVVTSVEIGLNVSIRRFNNILIEKYFALWETSAITEL
jgi:phage gp46-like protein